MELFQDIDWQSIFRGLKLAGIGYAVVLASLTGLYVVFRFLPNILKLRLRNKLMRQGNLTTKPDPKLIKANESAAIAAALYLYFNEIHDEDSHIMTIKRISKRYSPWSSKLYGMTNTIQRSEKIKRK